MVRDFFSLSSVGKSELEPVPAALVLALLERVPAQSGGEVKPVPIRAASVGASSGAPLLGASP
jgi:hypothetical protein